MGEKPTAADEAKSSVQDFEKREAGGGGIAEPGVYEDIPDAESKKAPEKGKESERARSGVEMDLDQPDMATQRPGAPLKGVDIKTREAAAKAFDPETSPAEGKAMIRNTDATL
jgi:hypothetical protein